MPDSTRGRLERAVARQLQRLVGRQAQGDEDSQIMGPMAANTEKMATM